VESGVTKTAELVLSHGPDAAPVARRFVAAELAGCPDSVTADAELVVTELVTNAFLHGAPPIHLRLELGAEEIRIEVEDTGRAVPVRAQRRSDEMTGRGLEMVAAVSTTWGVEASENGKVVWSTLPLQTADVSAIMPPDADIDALLAAWSDEQSLDPEYAVRLGSVPTELLLQAKAHIDNLVRELTLIRADEQASGRSLPAAIDALVTSATEDFAYARAEIKRQALNAARRGEVFTNLTLRLPLSAADAGERYLVALAQADRHASAARLLTMAPPRSHQAFREWYVRSLIAQLRAAANGERPPAAVPFSQVLVQEVDRLSALEVSRLRLEVLQKITGELAGALSVERIGATVVDAAAQFPGVDTARVYVLDDDDTLRSVARHGVGALDEDYDEIALSADLPGPAVARSGQPLFLRNRTRLYEQFPTLAGSFDKERSLHIVPLQVADHILGILTLTFIDGELPDDAQFGFVQAIGDALAQAIERVHALADAAANQRRDLALLSAQIQVLTDLVDDVPLGEILNRLLRAVESAIGDGVIGSILALDPDGIHLRHVAAPNLPAAYNEAIDGAAIGPAVGSCGTAAYRQERVVVVDIMTDPLWAEYRDLAELANVRACWSTPIVSRHGQLLGTFAMYYQRPHEPRAEDIALIDLLVQSVATAIEHAGGADS
jgi:GAF domain-containing protein/anti-sigma regulatory factor (Ser/Thr protein kinase)